MLFIAFRSSLPFTSDEKGWRRGWRWRKTELYTVEDYRRAVTRLRLLPCKSYQTWIGQSNRKKRKYCIIRFYFTSCKLLPCQYGSRWWCSLICRFFSFLIHNTINQSGEMKWILASSNTQWKIFLVYVRMSETWNQILVVIKNMAKVPPRGVWNRKEPCK